MLPGRAKNKSHDTWLCFHFTLTTELATATRRPKIGCSEWWIGWCQSQDYSSYVSDLFASPLLQRRSGVSQRTGWLLVFCSFHCGYLTLSNRTCRLMLSFTEIQFTASTCFTHCCTTIRSLRLKHLFGCVSSYLVFSHASSFTIFHNFVDTQNNCSFLTFLWS